MNRRIRKRHSAEFKAQVALAALQERETAARLALRYGVHPAQVAAWKKQAREGLAGVFALEVAGAQREQAELVETLYGRIGRLTTEVELLKKTV
jgi:transposase